MGKYLDKLKQFEGRSHKPNDSIVIEPASPTAKPIYWENCRGEILGPAKVEWLAQVSDAFWVIVTFEGQPRWIRSDRLRSRQVFEGQQPVREIVLVPRSV